MLKKDRLKRKMRIRGRLSGTEARPRLTVFRSNKFVYAQLVDDLKGVTLAEAHGEKADVVGSEIAKKAASSKVKTVVFDRNGYVYHGRVRQVAEAARAGGLIF